MKSDKDFFWGHLNTLTDLNNSIEYFTEEAMERGSENFTYKQIQDLLHGARNVRAAAEEMIKRITLPGSYSRPKKRVVRFKRKKDGTVVRPDGTEICKVCGDLIAPGSMGLHYRINHRLEEWWKADTEDE